MLVLLLEIWVLVSAVVQNIISGKKKLNFGELLRATNLDMALKPAASLGISSNDLVDHLLQLKFCPGIALQHLTPSPVLLGVPRDHRGLSLFACSLNIKQHRYK